MSSGLIGKESISRVHLWQRQTARPENSPRHRDNRIAKVVGSVVIEKLGQEHTAEEIIDIIEGAVADFLSLPDCYIQATDSRNLCFQKCDNESDKLWLMRALIPPQFAEEQNLFDILYGDLLELEKKWYEGFEDLTRLEIVAFFQTKYDSDWFPKV